MGRYTSPKSAVVRFNQAARELRDSVNTDSLSEAVARSNALLDQDQGPTAPTVVGHLHGADDSYASADIARKVAAFHEACAGLLEATGLPNMKAVVDAGVEIDVS